MMLMLVEGLGFAKFALYCLVPIVWTIVQDYFFVIDPNFMHLLINIISFKSKFITIIIKL